MSFVREPQYKNYNETENNNIFSLPVYNPIEQPSEITGDVYYSSSWQPETLDNNKLLENIPIKNNTEYRKFMTHKAIPIMKYNLDKHGKR